MRSVPMARRSRAWCGQHRHLVRASRSGRSTFRAGPATRSRFPEPLPFLFNDGRNVQAHRFSVIAALAAGLALSGCATTGTQGAATASAGGAANSGADTASASTNGPMRDLTPAEKKAIMDAVGSSLRNPASAKYKWAKIPAIVNDQSINYCGVVNGQSPYPAYSGEQAYIVEAQMANNRVKSAVMGLIAGGKDKSIVATMCEKYGLDPFKSS